MLDGYIPEGSIVRNAVRYEVEEIRKNSKEVSAHHPEHTEQSEISEHIESTGTSS